MIDSSENNQSPHSRLLPLYMGLAFLGTLAIGLILGFLARPLIIPDQVEVVEVVATAAISPVQSVAQAGTPSSDAESDAGAVAEQGADDQPQQATDASAAPTPTIMEFLLSDARHIQGEADAPVTVVEFSDFKWPYCSRFAVDSLGRIREEYIETGKVRFVYKNFAILGPESNTAAEGGECAAEQDMFWAYHDFIFNDQATTRSSLNEEGLIAMAADIGLDADAFGECLYSKRYASTVQQQAMSVQSLGVRGTPGFVINGVYISGAQPFEVFQQVIEEQLVALGESDGGASFGGQPIGPPPPSQ